LHTKKILLIFFLFVFSIENYPQEEVKKLEQELTTAKGKKRIVILNALTIHYQHKNVDLSYKTSEEQLLLANELGDMNAKVEALRNIGFYYYLKNSLKQADSIYSIAYRLSMEMGDSSEVASTLNNWGLIAWKQSDLKKSFGFYRRAINAARTVDNQSEIARSLNYIGLIFWKWGEYVSALNFFEKSLKLKSKLKNEYELAITQNNIAYIYNELGNYEQALSYSRSAIEIATRLNDKYALGRALNNIGTTYLKLGDYNTSLDYQLKGVKVKEESGDVNGIAYSYNDIGNIYFQMGNNSKAMEYFESSLRLREEIKDAFGISISLLSIGNVYLKENNYEKAKETFTRQIEMAKQNNLSDAVQKGYYKLYELYEKQGNVHKAFEYFKKYASYNDTVLRNENKDKLIELQVIYESETKEQEIGLLKKSQEIQKLQLENQEIQIYSLILLVLLIIAFAVYVSFRYRIIKKLKSELEEKNKEIAEQNNKLLEANSLKDKFFSIIAHDLRSPFQGLIGLSQILHEDFENISEEEKKTFIKRMRDGVKNVFELIENLLEWSRVRSKTSAITLKPISLYDSIRFVFSLQKHAAIQKEIELINSSNNSLKVLADQNMLQSTLNNLISNAIKFTREKGKIEVDAKETDNEVIILVKDNGVGIDPDDIPKLFRLDIKFTTPGTSREIGTGLGLILCKELVEKQGGRIWVESQLNMGTTFYFTLQKVL